MSTRSTIGIKRKDGTINSIYCHSDGYLEHNGVILLKHYNSLDRVNDLLKLGNLSFLDKWIKPDSSKVHDFFNRQLNTTIAYHRDRNEELSLNSFENQKDFENYCIKSDNEYIYLFDENKENWLYAKKDWESEELEFNNLKNKLIIDGTVDTLEERLDKLISKTIQYEREIGFDDYDMNYVNEEELYETFHELFLTEQGLDNRISQIGYNLTEYITDNNLYEEDTEQHFINTLELLKELNYYKYDMTNEKNIINDKEVQN